MKIKRKMIEGFFGGWSSPSRRVKKFIIGNKLSRSKLKKLIKSTFVVTHKYPESDSVYPFYFCPKCGCRQSKSYDHGVGYPEIYVTYTCLRCGHQVAYEDNSPYIHCLSEDENIPQIECSENCPCKKKKTIEEAYWRDIVPDQFLRATGIKIPITLRYV